ncbi:MAG: hypothetical protein LBM19_00405 [Holosporales bacterium]|jgi:NADH:ubiquinone oxidoreductase subunit K|nr:hypothetical protein [Holosporales bacterium]
MVSSESILILSGFLFSLGFLGLLKQASIVKTMVCIEIMMFASIVNFAYACGERAANSDGLAILVVVVLSGLGLSIVFTILASQLKENQNVNLLDEDKSV